MPTQIEWCPRCNAPVLEEVDVPGACACADGQLRGLLAKTRAANGRTRVASTQPELPPLDPEMWLSKSALQEMQAMMPKPPLPVAPAQQGQVRVASVARPAIPEEMDLGSLWGTSLENVVPESSGLQIEFDSMDDIDVQAYRPRESDRFRVDRPPPARPYPLTPGRAAVFEDGEYVRQRSSQEPLSISAVREAARQMATGEGRAPVRVAETRTSVSAPRHAPAQPQETGPSPTLYDRLIGGEGPLD